MDTNYPVGDIRSGKKYSSKRLSRRCILIKRGKLGRLKAGICFVILRIPLIRENLQIKKRMRIRKHFSPNTIWCG